MSRVYVTSDWHFGHKGITKFRKKFPTLKHMEEYILGGAMAMLTRRDVLYCLGDMAFTEDGLAKIAQLKCRKVLVRGNHDTLPTKDYLEVFTGVEGAVRYKGTFLTHIPIHPQELYRGVNVHGHCHRGGPDGPSYYNAIVEENDYLPIEWPRVMDILKARKEN